MALLGALAGTAGAAEAQAHPPAQLAVSQVYGGGGNSGAPYQNDFIEVFNRRGARADLTGYSVQYAAASSGTWTVTPLSGTLEIGQYFLVKEASGGGSGAALPAADATGTINLSASIGKVALVSSFTPLTGSCPSGPEVLDMVGYGGSATCFERSPTANLSNTLAAVRLGDGCTDTGDNRSDFAAQAPAPRNSGSGLNLCDPVPAEPTLTATDPPSPGTATSVAVQGEAPAKTTVELYGNADCSGRPLAAGSWEEFASPGLAVSVAPDSATSFHALAYDSNNTSACSAGSLTYVQDSTAPDPPSLDSTDPASPAADADPRVLGSAEAGSTVDLYASEDCSGRPAASGSAEELGTGGIAVTVESGSTTQLTATATDAAGNTSGCSKPPLAYSEDSLAPDSPSLDATDPRSPAADTNPAVIGSAEGGSAVSLYASPDCSGPAAAVGSAEDLASPGLAIGVEPNTTTSLSATATDAAGNTSSCSTPLDYAEDSIAPAAPDLLGTTPPSPASSTSPNVIGVAEAETLVRLYPSQDCSGSPAGTGTADELAGPGIGVTVAPGSVTSFRATSTDPAGNTSDCSPSAVTYTERSSHSRPGGEDARAGGKGPRVRLLWPAARKLISVGAERRVIFSFVAAAPATFRCRLDGRGYKPCRSPQGYSVRRGKHRFTVEATAKHGGTPTVSSFSFTVRGPKLRAPRK